MSRVYVVMGNDFPEAVFSAENLAAEFCKFKKAEDDKRIGMRTPIYWKYYAFKLNDWNGEQQ